MNGGLVPYFVNSLGLEVKIIEMVWVSIEMMGMMGRIMGIIEIIEMIEIIE